VTRPHAPRFSRRTVSRIAPLLTMLVTLHIGFAQSLQASFTTRQVTLQDGASRNLVVMVENTAPTEVTLAPEVTLPSELVLALTPQPLTLQPGESRPIFLSVLVPARTPPGEYEVVLDLLTEDGASVQAKSALRVPPRPQIIVTTLSQTQGDARWERSFQLEVVNNGNTTEQMRFELDSAPVAHGAIEPSEATLAPGESTLVTVSASSPLRTTGQQRLGLRALAVESSEPLAVANLNYQVLGSSARLRETERDLNFSVRLTYSPGANFRHPGLGAVGVSLRGGGLIDPDGNQRVRASISTQGFDRVYATGAYTSDTLDVALGVARRDYSSLGFSASGYGLTVDAELPDSGFTVGSYVLAERDLSAFAGAGAYVAGVGNGVSGGLQFTYDPALQRGVLSANTSFQPLALQALVDQNRDGDQGLDAEPQPAEAESWQQDAVDEVRGELDEASDDLPDAEGNQEQAVDDVQADLEDAIVSNVPPANAVVTVEGAVDTAAAVAGRVGTQVGAGPVNLSGDLGGHTAGFRGDSLSQREWGVGGNVSLGTVGEIGIRVGAEYRATDRFTADASPVLDVDAFAIGVGINAQDASVALTYSTSLQTAPNSGSWSRSQRFGVTTRALLQDVRLNARLSWLTRNDSQAGGAQSGSLLEVDAGANIPLASGAIIVESELEYDLLSQEIVNLQAEAVAVVNDIAQVNGDVRFGVRYRRANDYQWVTGLARWSGSVTPRVSASAGLQGTFAFVDAQVRRSITTSVSTSTILPLGHRLGVGGSVHLREQGDHSATVNVSYTVPFSVAVARIEGLGDLRGVLVDPNGEPVAGVELRVGRAAVVTGEDGTFLIEGLPVGEHTMLAVGGLDGMITDPELPLRVSVPDREVLELELTVHPAAAVEGRVTLATTQPLPGVIYGSGDRVRDEQTTRGLQIRLVNDAHEYVATSSQTGRFTFPAVMPGTYNVVIDTELSDLYNVEVLTPVLTLEPHQAVALQIIVHPVPRQIRMQGDPAGEGTK